VGIKLFGTDLEQLDALATEIEAVVREVPGTTSAFAERLTGAYYLDITPDLGSLAQYGVTLGEVQNVVAAALGGEIVTTILQGRERFSAIVRYPRELRDDPHRIGSQVLVPVPGGAQVPLGELARIEVRKGAPSIRTENAMLAAYIYVDTRESDLGRYVKAAQEAVTEQVQFPPGYYVTWSGQYEYMQRAAEKMRVVVPVTLALIFLLLYLNFRRVTESLIVMLSVPFALVGGIWLMWMLDYNTSVAVIVGFIALAGVAAETGVVMLIYLDHALEARAAQRQAEGRALDSRDLREAIIEGAVDRVRPKMMTVVAIMAGLLPIMWSSGTGSEVMRRIAAPMVGGMVSSTILTLVVIPALYSLIKQRQLARKPHPSSALPKEK
jgi:Cu(I)/Ag(I) efflux system membrane protein CusA/SilA